MPLFTIITICLNCKDKLIKTAQSLSNQSFCDYEYVIKDGNSNDGTKELLSNLNADISVSNNDNGIFDAMNQAIEISSGKYIYFLNAGDILYNSKVLEEIAKQIKQTGNKIDLFYGDVVKPYARRKYLVHPNKLSHYYLFTKGLCHQTWFLSRKAYLNLGGFKTFYKENKIQLGGDYFLLLELCIKNKIKTKHIPIFVVKYEGNGISADLTLIKKRLLLEKKIKKDIYGIWKYRLYSLYQYLEYILKKIIYDTILYRLISYFNEKKYLNENKFK